MKIGHAAALALVGWYLVTPPWQKGKNAVEEKLDAPLSKWIQSHAFDSAAECEALREQVIKAQKDAGISVTAERCVASDDPRLKEQ